LKESITNLPPNVTLHVTASDPGFKADVRAFASSNGLILKDITTTKGIIKASLMKSGDAHSHTAEGSSCSTAACGSQSSTALAPEVRKGATIVVFSEEFDKVLASLVIANGAAAMGGDVTLFFTFWGLNALRDANRHANTPKSAIDNMFGMMMPKGKDSLPLSHMNFGGLGAAMMKHVMKSKNLPNLPDLLASAKAQKIRLVACAMSMEAMGIKPEELIDGVEYGGVAEYLAAAEKSGTNLFI
jgi:peroxiredoxin family protein